MLELQSRHRTEHPGPKNHTSSCGVFMFLSGTGLCGQLIEALHDTWQFLGFFFLCFENEGTSKDGAFYYI